MEDSIDDQLDIEFQRIKEMHRSAMRTRVARVTLGASVMRVFAKGTKAGLLRALQEVLVDDLPNIARQGRFDDWYEEQLERIAAEIRVLNLDNSRVLPGLKWGHSGIKDIDSRAAFRKFQDILETAAKSVGVPRTWFDDNWADRQTD